MTLFHWLVGSLTQSSSSAQNKGIARYLRWIIIIEFLLLRWPTTNSNSRTLIYLSSYTATTPFARSIRWPRTECDLCFTSEMAQIVFRHVLQPKRSTEWPPNDWLTHSTAIRFCHTRHAIQTPPTRSNNYSRSCDNEPTTSDTRRTVFFPAVHGAGE